MTEKQISVIRRHIKENPKVETNSALAKIIVKKSRLELSEGTLRKYIAAVKAMPTNVVEIKAGSLLDTVKTKKLKVTKPKTVITAVKGSDYDIDKQTEKVNKELVTIVTDHITAPYLVQHIKNISNGRASVFKCNTELIAELYGYGVKFTDWEGKEWTPEDVIYEIIISDSLVLDKPENGELYIVTHDNHFYDVLSELVGSAVPTGAVITLLVDIPWHTPGTSTRVSQEDAIFYFNLFKNTHNVHCNLLTDQNDFSFINSFKDFHFDEIKYRENILTIEDIDEIEDEY
jgi:hypothetical protein